MCEEIGAALRDKAGFHVVVMRSTMLPGTMRDVVIPTLEEASGKRAGSDFGVCINPEFLREGTAVHDYYHPPKTVIGEVERARAATCSRSSTPASPAPLIRTDIETAEMVKYADNAWHALKVAFANEIGNICKALDVDSHEVMEIFCQDTKLNLSPYYLKPGFAFGGSCLPKDVRALAYKAKHARRRAADPRRRSCRATSVQIERGIQMVIDKGNAQGRRPRLLASRPAPTTCARARWSSSIERLIGKGYDLRDLRQQRQAGRAASAPTATTS